MESVKIIPTESQIHEMARQNAIDTLKGLSIFQSMSFHEQKDLYRNVLDDEKQKLKKNYGLQMATDSGADMGYKGYDPGFKGDTQAFTDLVKSVDFPQFVGDLMKGVFNANLKVMKEQTDSYIKLMKEATKSVGDFVKKVKDDDALAKLAETKSDKYNIMTENAPDGTSKLALTTPQGDKIDHESDTEAKMHLMDAKIKMAQEHRAALREIILMGVTRLVVEKGEIEAGVEFNITANRKSKAHHEDRNINNTTVNMQYDSPLGGLFGGPSGSMEMTNTNIQVNTSDKETSDTLSAKLMGHVKLIFKTDYFKLDNFASMYGDGGTQALKPNAPAAPAPAAPGR